MRKVVSEVCVNAHDKTRAVSSVGKACAAPYVWISNKLCCIGYDGASCCTSGAAGIIRAAGIAGRRIIVRASSVRRCCCRDGASCAGRCVVCRCCIICSTACGCFCFRLSCSLCLARCLGCFCCLTCLFCFSCFLSGFRCFFGCNLFLNLLDLCVLLCQDCVVLCSHVIQVCNLVLVVIGNGFLLLEHFLEGLLLCFLLCLAGFQVCFLVCELIAVIRYLLYQIHVLLQALSVVFV